MDYQNEFKYIDTLEKAYILGLLIADGCVFYNKQAISYVIILKLQEKDKHILDSIVKLFPFFTEGKVEISKNDFKSYSLRKYSKQLFNDLSNFGMLPNKSYINANNVFLPNFNDDLFFCYLHGLFDGDGTIYQCKRGRIRVEICGVNHTLYTQIQDRLLKLGIKSTVYYRKKRNYWLLRISNKENVKKLIQQFEKTPIYLKRKFAPFFNADWDRIPGMDNRYEQYPIWFAITSKP